MKATWEEFTKLAYDPAYKSGKAYYYRGYLRIEMTPLGWNYAQDNSIISTLVTLFCALKEIPVIELTNCSFRKTCLQEAQPDLAFYINSLENQPSRGNSAVDLNQFRLLRWWWQSLLLLSVMIKGRNVCFMKIWGARVLDC